jgi:UDP-N-acetylglucosamine--N-acetylmuramyl-(pentapeptide) pyrophosphoryl-undecaprenol N-acetylglucosamine transferase
MPDSGGKRVLIAAGKTGGHIFPSLVLAESLVASGCEVILVTGGSKVENIILRGKNLKTIALPAPKLKGMGFWQKASGLARLPGILSQAFRIVSKEAPDLVMGFGGASAGPIVLAAKLLGKRTAICEQNAVLGFANAILAPLVDKVFLGLEKTRGHLGVGRSEVIGTPVRGEILAVKPKQYANRASRVLVTGGSQGASFLNTNIPPVLESVAKAIETIEVLHQTGIGNAEEVQKKYDAIGVQARCVEFIGAMESAYEWADFVIGRAGASTIAEITAIGIPALLIPFAKASDNHQVQNAKILVEAGAALMFEEESFVGETVANAIRSLLGDKKKLDEMAGASRRLGKRDALERLTNRVLELLKA